MMMPRKLVGKVTIRCGNDHVIRQDALRHSPLCKVPPITPRGAPSPFLFPLWYEWQSLWI